MVRVERVNELVNAASDGMSKLATDSTANEVTSAILTMCQRAVRMAKQNGADLKDLRRCVGLILIECADEAQVN